MAAGPKTICEEFLRDANKAYFACGHAAGMDCIPSFDDWKFLHDTYCALVDKLNAIIPTLPEGSYESIMAEKYGNDDDKKTL